MSSSIGSPVSFHTPPPKKEGWDHSERVLVYYPAVPQAGFVEKWSIAYYHYNPPFKKEPEWVDFFVAGRTPFLWWPLPDVSCLEKLQAAITDPAIASGIVSGLQQAADDARKRVSDYSPEKKAELLQEAVKTVQGVPPWADKITSIPVQDLRNFLSNYGYNVHVLVAWSQATGEYQFVTVGSDRFSSDMAVRLRNRIVEAVEATALGPATEDLRGDHNNVAFTMEEIDFLLWSLGRLWGVKESLSEVREGYIDKHHDPIVAKLGHAKSILLNQPT